MRWLVITLLLLAVCAAGAAWIYFRDWERPSVYSAQLGPQYTSRT